MHLSGLKGDHSKHSLSLLMLPLSYESRELLKILLRLLLGEEWMTEATPRGRVEIEVIMFPCTLTLDVTMMIGLIVLSGSLNGRITDSEKSIFWAARTTLRNL